jgi:hypothetical protein
VDALLGPRRIPEVVPEAPEMEIAFSNVENDLVDSMTLLIVPAPQ